MGQTEIQAGYLVEALEDLVDELSGCDPRLDLKMAGELRKLRERLGKVREKVLYYFSDEGE